MAESWNLRQEINLCQQTGIFQDCSRTLFSNQCWSSFFQSENRI